MFRFGESRRPGAIVYSVSRQIPEESRDGTATAGRKVVLLPSGPFVPLIGPDPGTSPFVIQ
jgi:hypothetical protein